MASLYFMLLFISFALYIVGGPNFGDWQGYLLIIVKALYGLWTSVARWHEKFEDKLIDMGLYPYKANPDVWMKDYGTHAL
jgi:hypothetical protein